MTDETRTFDSGDVATPPQRSGDGSTSESPGGGMRVRPEFLPASDAWPSGEPGRDPFAGEHSGQGREASTAQYGAQGRDPFAAEPGAPARDPFTAEGGTMAFGAEGHRPAPHSGDATGLIPFAAEGRRPGDDSASGWGNPAGGPLPPSPGGPGGPGGPAGFGGPGGLYGAPPPPPPRGAYGMGPGWAPPPGAPPAETGGSGSRGPRTGVLATLAVVIALVASILGSLGTYLLTRSGGSGINPSYSLGTPSGVVVNRPPDSVAGVASKVLPSVVSLEVRGNSEAGTGSGFLIKGGYIVTNNHVVAAAAQTGTIKVTFNNKKSTTGTIVGRDPSSDIAVVRPADTFGAPEIFLGNSDRVVVGDPVIAIGSPLGLSGTVTTGIVSSLNRPVTAGGESGSESSFINAIQTDAAINPGNSGGPLVNAAGEVIGVNSAIATLGNSSLGGQSGSIGLGFSIPVNHVRRIAEELVTTGTAKKSRIGVSIDENYTGEGVRIAATPQGGQQPVTPGGPADKAGLKPGDVILSVDDTPVTQPSELIVTIRSKAPGDKVTIKYQRNGSERTTTVTIDAVPVPTPQPS
ncbi:trypsin-like peptidase domain-containing protein [Sphaerisporangium sp. NPDC005289]|uniref:S1C family serine protease n=1 Tax=Sphaerisporangium sp. NPDC005289 TaxID=3155247 RepID=UPI0033B30304